VFPIRSVCGLHPAFCQPLLVALNRPDPSLGLLPTPAFRAALELPSQAVTPSCAHSAIQPLIIDPAWCPTRPVTRARLLSRPHPRGLFDWPLLWLCFRAGVETPSLQPVLPLRIQCSIWVIYLPCVSHSLGLGLIPPFVSRFLVVLRDRPSFLLCFPSWRRAHTETCPPLCAFSVRFWVYFSCLCFHSLGL